MNIQNRQISTKQVRGSALMSALALAAISMLTLVGFSLLVISYSTRQNRDRDYAAAMHLAEAGLNYEMRYISTNLANSPAAHTSTSPYVGSIPSVTGSFSAYSQSATGASTWRPPQAIVLTSTGTVNGISRTVTINSQGYNAAFPPSAQFAVFGYTSVTFSGASSAINGNIGTNGLITTSNGGGGSINGNVILAGSGASQSGSLTSRGTIRLASPVTYPTIDTIVSELFVGGWSYLSAQAQLVAQAARIRKYVTNSPVLTPAGTTSANWSWNVTDLANNNAGALPVSTMILTPGDYYFTSVQVSGSTKIVCDTAAQTLTNGVPGAVRIWIGGSGTQQDTMNIDVSFTSQDPKLFRLYYNKASALSLGGNLTYYGGIYAVRAAANSGVTPATLSFSGSSKVYGAVIGDVVKITGGSVMTYPAEGLASTGDYVDKYGFSDNWKEVAGGRATIFTDSTNR